MKNILELKLNDLLRFIQRKIKSLVYQDTVPNLSQIQKSNLELIIKEKVKLVYKGEKLENVLSGFDGKEFNERIVEYCFFSEWIMNKEKTDILDVGCVLNNPIVDSIITQKCNNVWFCNVAIEPIIHLQNPVFYHVESLEKSFKYGETFDLITCLSTIEHIGLDNSQYGRSLKQTVFQPTPQTLIESVEKLANLLKRNGSLLISVPYGNATLLRHPKTFKYYSQVFDYRSLTMAQKFLIDKGMKVDFVVYASSHDGWSKVDKKNDNYSYGVNTPSAEAVAFLAAEFL